ncbi:hypothetical protein Tco_0598378 [Tanacetum coccineum]
MEENAKPVVQHQRRVNPKIHEVIKQEVIKLLDAGLIYPISDSPWVSPVHCVPKKGGITVVKNEENELIPTRLVTGWRVCIDYQKLNDATRKDHFPLPFMDQMLERLAGNEYYCFLDGFSGYFQIPIDPLDQVKDFFTGPYGDICLIVACFWVMQCTGHVPKAVCRNLFHDMIEKNHGKNLSWMISRFRPYLVLSKSIVYTGPLALKILVATQDAKPRLLGVVVSGGKKLLGHPQKIVHSGPSGDTTVPLPTAKKDLRFRQALRPAGSGNIHSNPSFSICTVELSKIAAKFKVNGHRLKHYFGGDVPHW